MFRAENSVFVGKITRSVTILASGFTLFYRVNPMFLKLTIVCLCFSNPSYLFVSYWWLKNSVNIKQQQQRQQQVVIINLIKLPWLYIYIILYIYIFIVIRGIIIIAIIIIYIYSLTIVAVISHGFHVSSVTSSGSISSGRTALASVPMDMSGARCIPKVRSTCGISTIYGCRMRIIYTYHHLPVYIIDTIDDYK